MSVLDAITGLLAVTVLMAVRNKDLVYEDIYKGIHDDENERLIVTG